jgi:hypothetical protein
LKKVKAKMSSDMPSASIVAEKVIEEREISTAQHRLKR